MIELIYTMIELFTSMDNVVVSKAYTEILIKGIIKYNDPANNSIDDESIVFGCNSRSKIIGGIIADTSNVVIKQRAVLDVPYIKMISTSEIKISCLVEKKYSQTCAKILCEAFNLDGALVADVKGDLPD